MEFEFLGEIGKIREELTDEWWSDFVTNHPALNPVKSCALVNPMTGEGVEVIDPPNLLALILTDGVERGVLRLSTPRRSLEIYGNSEAVREFVDQIVTDLRAEFIDASTWL